MPVPTPSGHIFESPSPFGGGSNAGANREELTKGADVAAQEAIAWTAFGNELAELAGKLQSPLGHLDGLTNLPTVKPKYFGTSTQIPPHGVNAEEMISHLTALMRDSRAIGAAYEAASHQLAAAVAEHAE
ncbi:hypothetical protein ABZ345_02785 [Lentzea sp. NPDC005914]|uniref:hypothetical protein n=1 Tax=Lentzea sp. NPDC005914 TaxID=3154572 RepID=UPI0033E5D2E4